MIIKGEWSKILILSILFVSVFSFVSAQVEPPGLDTGEKIAQKAGSSTKSFISKVGEKIKTWIYSIVPFLENSNEKIAEWWEVKAKPWSLEAYNSLVLYLNKEIVIK